MQYNNSVLNPSLGSDPEVFVYSTTLDLIYPVIGLLGGTKDKPKPLEEEGYFVQEDNVLAEFNIPPSKDRVSFVKSVGRGLSLLNQALPDGFEPVIRSSHRFAPALLDDPRAQEFGCTPDFNAWTLTQNPTPSTEGDPTLRSAGGHVLIGYDNHNEKTNALIIKYLDALLGVPSVILDGDMDRRKLYGKAGAFRHKAFGVEYRTLSSFWIKRPELTGWIWDQSMRAIDLINRGDASILEHEPYIIDTINTGNVNNAKEFVSKYSIALP